MSGRIQGWDMPDRDVAIIDTTDINVSYAHRLMNICMALSVNPVSGEIAVIGTDGTNERRFEPVLNGVFLRVNLALVDPLTGTNRLRDLNPHLDYVTRTLPQAERARTLSDPRGIEWNSAGTRAYITGMGSRNLIIVNSDGERGNPQPIELGEGPTGMALDEDRSRLYVWNHFSSTISVVDTTAGAVVTNIAVFNPTPEVVQKGRRHLYDTRRTSGLGLVSCGSCHVDARFDRLAWDLGDPSGSRTNTRNFSFHPMKGPMVTQTLQDIITPTNFGGRALEQVPLHWRGDRRNIEAFNPTFTALLGNDVELTPGEMAEFKGLLQSIFFPPNFLRTFSNSLPAAVPLPGHYGRVPTNGGPRQPLPPGNALAGRLAFRGVCGICHDFNLGIGGALGRTNDLIVLTRSGTEGAFKSSQLRSLADKVGMDGGSTNSRAGVGFMHDGRVDTLTSFLVDGFPTAVRTDQAIADMIALLLCFTGSEPGGPAPSSPSQDVPAATGKQVTFASSAPAPLLDAMLNLATRTNSRVELVIRGARDGQRRNWLFQRSPGNFQADRHGETMATLTAVINPAAAGNEFTATLVPEGSGRRLALDRDGDGYFDGSEVEVGFDPADPSSRPGRIVSLLNTGGVVTLSWQSAPGARYAVEWRTNLPPATGAWSTVAAPFTATLPLSTYTGSPAEGTQQAFYRVRMEP